MVGTNALRDIDWADLAASATSSTLDVSILNITIKMFYLNIYEITLEELVPGQKAHYRENGRFLFLLYFQ